MIDIFQLQSNGYYFDMYWWAMKQLSSILHLDSGMLSFNSFICTLLTVVVDAEQLNIDKPKPNSGKNFIQDGGITVSIHLSNFHMPRKV